MSAGADTDAETGPAVRRLADWDAGRLRELADEHGTPLYMMDLDRVRANYRRFCAAFPDATVMYAAKAHTGQAVLGALVEAGAPIECAAAGEIERALRAGADPDRLQYTAVNPPAADLDYAVEVAAEHPGLTVTVGAEDSLDRLAERGYDGRLCLRVNPGIGAGHHEKVATGSHPKFGLPYDRVPGVAAEARERFDLVGLHAHAGSGMLADDMAAHREYVARMGELARAVGGLEFLDIGGGFGVPYREDEAPLDLQAVADATREAFGERDLQLGIEPGRYFVADAGVLLATVNTVKETPGTTVVGVDAGMTDLVRPAMYGAYHAIRSLAPDADAREWTEAEVAGPICETADVFGRDRPLPAPERGDVLAVGNVGAYGYEMASHYNSRPRPAVVALEGDGSAVVREREAIADVVRGERGVPWR
ncbi:MAG: diaminopimelate decarboxylase [Halobacteriaceae archaeon]